MTSRSERLLAAFAQGLIGALVAIDAAQPEETPTRTASPKKSRSTHRKSIQRIERTQVDLPTPDPDDPDPENELLVSARDGVRSGEVRTDDLYTMDDVENFLRTMKTKAEPPAETYNPDADPETKKAWVAPS